MTKEKIIEDLEGTKGVVGAFAFYNINHEVIPVRRVEETIADNVQYCNILAHVFFRTKDPLPGRRGAVYTSVVHASDKLYFSFHGENSGSINPGGLNDIQVWRIYDSVCSLSIEDATTWVDLVIKMQLSNNNIVGNKLGKYVRELQKLHRDSDKRESDKYIMIINKLYTRGAEWTDDNDAFLRNDQRFKSDFVAKIFESFGLAAQINELKSFLTNKQYEIVPAGPVHVEVKGVCKAAENLENIKFDVGLATSTAKEIGCCTCCSLEFRALEWYYKFIINRTADYDNNFPPNNYQMSSKLKEHDALLKNFCQNLITMVGESVSLSGLREFEYLKKLVDDTWNDGVQSLTNNDCASDELYIGGDANIIWDGNPPIFSEI